MGTVKICAYACIAGMGVAFVFATLADPMAAGFFALLAQPNTWPFVVLVDLSFGLLFFVLFIFAIEGDMTRTVLWAVPMLLFGNIVSAIYLIVNLDKVRARLPTA